MIRIPQPLNLYLPLRLSLFRRRPGHLRKILRRPDAVMHRLVAPQHEHVHLRPHALRIDERTHDVRMQDLPQCAQQVDARALEDAAVRDARELLCSDPFEERQLLGVSVQPTHGEQRRGDLLERRDLLEVRADPEVEVLAALGERLGRVAELVVDAFGRCAAQDRVRRVCQGE